MSPDAIKAIIEAALEAAKAISRITPTDWDDRLVPIAEVIVAFVTGNLLATDELNADELAACRVAAEKIKAAVE